MFFLSLDLDTTIVRFYSHLQFFFVAEVHNSVVVQTEVLQNLNKTYMKRSDKINEKLINVSDQLQISYRLIYDKAGGSPLFHNMS